MANIEAKTRENLSYNAGLMVDRIDTGIDGGSFPITAFYVDASIDEIGEAMKFIIDSGWLGAGELYARKVKSSFNRTTPKIEAVLFTCNSKDFEYGVNHGYISIQSDYPLVIGTPRITVNRETKVVSCTYDGDVFVKPSEGKRLSLKDWNNKKEQKTLAMSIKPSDKKED